MEICDNIDYTKIIMRKGERKQMLVPESNRKLRLKIRGKGVTVKEVAETMNITTTTLYYHLGRIMTEEKKKQIERAISIAHKKKYNK